MGLGTIADAEERLDTGARQRLQLDHFALQHLSCAISSCSVD